MTVNFVFKKQSMEDHLDPHHTVAGTMIARDTTMAEADMTEVTPVEVADPDLGLRGVVVGASQGLPEETHHLGVDLGPPEGHHQETDQGQELGPDLSPQ